MKQLFICFGTENDVYATVLTKKSPRSTTGFTRSFTGFCKTGILVITMIIRCLREHWSSLEFSRQKKPLLSHSFEPI